MSQHGNTLNRWSSQFGLYKYPETEPHYDVPIKRESNCKKCVQFILIAMIISISIVVVCLLMVDFATMQDTPKNDTLDLNNYEDLDVLKLSLKDDSTEVVVSKENITFVESTIHNISRMDTSEDSEYQSPKPFGFEYKHSYPMPFHKSERNNTNYPQLSNYRSANKMRNIEELIRYMGDQLFKDKNDDSATVLNPNRRIKFSGIYLRPRKSNTQDTGDVYERKSTQKSIKDVKNFPTEFSKQTIAKHSIDPFYTFKPNQPGDINLLAERKFRFAPTYAQSRLNHHKIPKQPIKYIPLYDNTKCDDYNCNRQESSDYNPSLDVEEYDFEEQPTLKIGTIKGHSKKRPLSVMLDIYPMEDQDEQTMAFPDHLKEPPTTVRPKVKFRPKPLYPPPTYPYPQHPNYYPSYGYYPTGYYHHKNYNQQISNRTPFRPQNMLPAELQTRYARKKNNTSENSPTQMLVHLNLYPRKKIVKKNKNDENIYEVIDRRSKDEDDYTPGINITDDDIILSNFSKDTRRSIIDAILAKYNKNPNEFPLNEEVSENMTIDDIKNGYGFKFPGPKLMKYDLPDGISQSAVRLLSISRGHDDKNVEERSKHVTKRNHNSSHSHDVFNETVPNINSTQFGESFAVFELNSNDSMSDNDDSAGNTTSIEEFIAVPILDEKF